MKIKRGFSYSRNMKKTSIGKRILTSWAVVAMLFSLIGFGIGAIVFHSKTESLPETQKETLIYRKQDEGIFEGGGIETE